MLLTLQTVRLSQIMHPDVFAVSIISGVMSFAILIQLQGSLTLYGGIRAPGWPSGICLASWQATVVYLLFLGSQAAMHILLPGTRGLGIPLKSGQRLTYKFTGTGIVGVHQCCILLRGLHEHLLSSSLRALPRILCQMTQDPPRSYWAVCAPAVY